MKPRFENLIVYSFGTFDTIKCVINGDHIVLKFMSLFAGKSVQNSYKHFCLHGQQGVVLFEHIDSFTETVGHSFPTLTCEGRGFQTHLHLGLSILTP